MMPSPAPPFGSFEYPGTELALPNPMAADGAPGKPHPPLIASLHNPLPSNPPPSRRLLVSSPERHQGATSSLHTLPVMPALHDPRCGDGD